MLVLDTYSYSMLSSLLHAAQSLCQSLAQSRSSPPLHRLLRSLLNLGVSLTTEPVDTAKYTPFLKIAETPSWRTIRTPSRRDDSRGQNREPQSPSLRNPLWNDPDFVPGSVEPHSICSSYPTMSPPGFHDWVAGRISKLHKQKPISPEPSRVPESISRCCRLFT